MNASKALDILRKANDKKSYCVTEQAWFYDHYELKSEPIVSVSIVPWDNDGNCIILSADSVTDAMDLALNALMKEHFDAINKKMDAIKELLK